MEEYCLAGHQEDLIKEPDTGTKTTPSGPISGLQTISSKEPDTLVERSVILETLCAFLNHRIVTKMLTTLCHRVPWILLISVGFHVYVCNKHMNTIVNHIAILKIKATRRYLHIFPFK
jgi:hypothetical protein